eukprot:jgi/Ulvmu1/11587/UM079_0031.1
MHILSDGRHAPVVQAVLNDMDRVRTEITGDRKFVADAYESLIALVLLCCSSGLIILFLVSFASICQSKTVLNYSAVALPVSGLVIWCTVAVVYGTWIVAHDVCDVADAYEAAAVGSELHAAAEQIVFPCPNTTAAAILSYNSKKTMLGLSNAVNQLVTDQYNLPVMSNFTDEPLLCEAYALEPNQSYTAVVCPYPTTQHRLTAATWEANSIGIRCFGNNNDLCAAGATPITQDVFMSVLQLLVHVEAAESVRLSADAVSGCTFARDTVANVANRHCRRDDLRGLLFTAWVALLVAGGAGVTLLPLVLLLQRMMAPTGIAAVEAVYNPGYSLPLKTLAAGWREEDYTPGAASQVKMGNMAPKPKKQPAPKYEGETEIVKDADWLASKDEDDLAGLEDDFIEDRMLESIRRQRLKELQDAANRPMHGRLESIRSSDFRQAVTDASESAWVVATLYKDNHEGCAVLLDSMSKLAARHPYSKFVQIISTDCIPDLPDANLPTVLVYHAKKCQKTFAGLTVWGGKRASEEYATLVLNELGPICRSAEEDVEIAMDRDAQRLVKRVILQREQEDEDSDFD